MANGPLNVIASDGAPAATVQTDTVVMSPAAFEILVDMNQIASNDLMVTYSLAEAPELGSGVTLDRWQSQAVALTLTGAIERF